MSSNSTICLPIRPRLPTLPKRSRTVFIGSRPRGRGRGGANKSVRSTRGGGAGKCTPLHIRLGEKSRFPMHRRSPVSWERFSSDGTFAFTGKLGSVTYRPGPHAPGLGPERLEQLRKLAERFD